MASDVSDQLRRQFAERAYHVCEYCLIHEDDTFWGCQVDHIMIGKQFICLRLAPSLDAAKHP